MTKLRYNSYLIYDHLVRMKLKENNIVWKYRTISLFDLHLVICMIQNSKASAISQFGNMLNIVTKTHIGLHYISYHQLNFLNGACLSYLEIFRGIESWSAYSVQSCMTALICRLTWLYTGCKVLTLSVPLYASIYLLLILLWQVNNFSIDFARLCTTSTYFDRNDRHCSA
jgi:hypothetical protein